METVSQNQSVRPIFNLLKITFGIMPIAAGLDKFTNILTNWENYLPASVKEMLPVTPHVFMLIVGVIEIIAGLWVLVKPSVGGIIVALWLTAISITIVASGTYLDIAVRDLVMAISAYSMARIGKKIGSN